MNWKLLITLICIAAGLSNHHIQGRLITVNLSKLGKSVISKDQLADGRYQQPFGTKWQAFSSSVHIPSLLIHTGIATSILCSIILSLMCLKLGRRHLLLNWMSIVMGGSNLLKIYVVTLKIFVPSNFHPTMITGPILVLNQSAGAAYNGSLLLVSIHIWLIITRGSSYDSMRWQPKMLFGGIISAVLQAIHTLWRIPNIYATDAIPFNWGSVIILIILIIISPIIMIHLLYLFKTTRKRSLEYLRQSSVSQSLFIRLWLGLSCMIIITGQALVSVFTANLSQSKDRFAPFKIFEITHEQIVSRYFAGALGGIAVFVIFASSEEMSNLTRKTIRRWKWWIIDDLFRIRISHPHGPTTASMSTSNLPMSQSNMNNAYHNSNCANLLGGPSTKVCSEESCGLPNIISRVLDGSMMTVSTIQPLSSVTDSCLDVMASTAKLPANRRMTLVETVTSPLHEEVGQTRSKAGRAFSVDELFTGTKEVEEIDDEFSNCVYPESIPVPAANCSPFGHPIVDLSRSISHSHMPRNNFDP